MNIRQQFENFISFIIEFSLLLETEFHLNQFLIVIFSILGALIPLSYSIIPKYLESNNSNYFQIAAKIIRPHLLLPNNSYTYAMIFLSFALLVFGEYATIFIFFKHKIDKLKQKKYLQLITFLNQIFDIWLINSIIELLLLSSNVLSIISLLFYLFFLGFRLLITKTQLFLKQDTLNISNISFLVYLVQLFNLTQIGIFLINTDKTGTLTFYQLIIGLLINLCTIINIIIYSPIVNEKISAIVLAIHLNSFLYNIFNLIQLESQSPISEIEILFVILMPLNLKLAKQYLLKTLLHTLVEQSNPFQLVNAILYLKQNYSYSPQRILIESIVCKGNKILQVEPLRFTAVQQEDLVDFYLRLSLKHQEVCNISLMQLAKDDLVSHLSLLLRLELYFQAYLFISKQDSGKHYSIISKIKFDICASKCRESLNYHMMVNNNIESAKEFDLNIKKFMDIEAKNLDLCKNIVNKCLLKIHYLQTFNYEEIDKLYVDSNILVMELEILVQRVKSLYHIYPSNRIQNVIAFIQAELLNDYLSAHKTVSQGALQEDKIYKNNASIKIDLYSAKTTYLIINLDNLKIIRSSSNANHFFSTDQLILNNLIPNGVREYHDSMIKNFIKTGKSKFFRNVQQGIYIHKGFAEGVSMFTEIMFEKNQLNALMVFSVQEEDQIIMIVDNQFRIVGLSEEFFKIVGGKPDQIELIYDIPVEYVIPKFKLQAEDQQIQKLSIRFLTKERLFDFVTLLVHYKSKRNIIDLMDGCWLDSQNYDVYESHCKIYDNHERYYIIRFNYLKNSSRRTETQSASQTRSFARTKIFNEDISEIQYDEQIEMLLPYEESEPKYINDIIIIQQHPDILLSNRESNVNDRCTLFGDDQGKSYLARNSLQLAENSQNQLMMKQYSFQQQAYFQQKGNHQKQSNDEGDESQEVEMEGRSSQISQLSGQKKAFYYKKYVLIEKMVQSSNSNQVQKIFIFVIFLQFLVFISQITLGLLTTENTLNQYQTNLDLLQIKYYLFQPLLSFIVTRYTIINYNAQQTAKTITTAQLNKYLVFPNSNLNLGFDDVRQNEAEILDRLTLQDFLAEYYDIYIYITTDTGELFNITMRQTLSILINYQYTFKAAYIYDKKSVSDSPYIFYSYRNLITMYDSFDSLNLDLYKQTLLRVTEDQDKEIKMFYPFIILMTFLISLQIFWFLKNQARIASIIGLMTFNQPYTIQKDIERLTSFVEQITKNSDTLFKYQFVLEKKEAQLKLQQKQLQLESSVKRLEYQKKYLSNKFGYLLIAIQFVFIISFTLAKYYINLNYFTKFSPTASFYQQVTDLGTNIPTIYSMREVLYYRWRYPFYTTNDTAIILQYLQACLPQVQSVVALLQSMQIGDYLFSSEFNQYMSEIETTNICNYLSDDMKQRSQIICTVTMAGSFLNGLTGSLIYMYQSILNEMQINYFLNKTEDTVNELEGAFILSQVIKSVNTQMKTDLITQTSRIILSISTICVMAFLYVFLSLFVVVCILRPFLKRQYFKAKRYLYLIPQQTLFLDDAFERLARSVMQEQKIIAQS